MTILGPVDDGETIALLVTDDLLCGRANCPGESVCETQGEDALCRQLAWEMNINGLQISLPLGKSLCTCGDILDWPTGLFPVRCKVCGYYRVPW